MSKGKSASAGFNAAKKSILDSRLGTGLFNRVMDPNGDRLKSWLTNPEWRGSADIARFDTSKSKPTKKDFENVTGIGQDEFISALKSIHPGAEIELKYRHYNRDKYARVYARPAYTKWEIVIK